MIKKSIFLLAAVVAMCFTSCEDYDHDIADINDRLDLIEGISLTTIDQQIATINGSIKDLKAVDAELNSYIDALEATAEGLQSQLDETNAALAALETDLEGSELFEVSLGEFSPTRPADEAADTTVGTAGTSIAGMLCEGRFAL